MVGNGVDHSKVCRSQANEQIDVDFKTLDLVVFEVELIFKYYSIRAHVKESRVQT